MIFESYEDFVNNYVKGKSEALFTMACLDFLYHCVLMKNETELDVCYKVWQLRCGKVCGRYTGKQRCSGDDQADGRHD